MTSTPENLGEIFKRDTKGRVRVPRARREMLLDELERNGGSAAQLLATWGSNIQRWPTGFKNGGNKGEPQSALVKTGKGLPDLPKVNGRWVEAVVARPEECDKPEDCVRAAVTELPVVGFSDVIAVS